MTTPFYMIQLHSQIFTSSKNSYEGEIIKIKTDMFYSGRRASRHWFSLSHFDQITYLLARSSTLLVSPTHRLSAYLVRQSTVKGSHLIQTNYKYGKLK